MHEFVGFCPESILHHLEKVLYAQDERLLEHHASLVICLCIIAKLIHGQSCLLFSILQIILDLSICNQLVVCIDHLFRHGSLTLALYDQNLVKKTC